MAEKTIITVCPSCEAKYKLKASAVGSDLTCKKCGHQFKARSTENNLSVPLIGRLAVNYKLINEAQLEKALKIKKELEAAGQTPTLEDILRKHEMVPEKLMGLLHAAREFWDIRQLDKRFGQLAVDKGFISSEAVDKALALQTAEFRKTKTGRKLGDILVEAGALTKAQRDEILTDQERLSEEETRLAQSEKKIMAEREAPSSPEPASNRESRSPKADHEPTGTAALETPADNGDEVPNDMVPQIPDKQIELDNALVLQILKNGTLAQVTPKDAWREDHDVEAMQDILFDEGITTGIVEDAVIEAFLKDNRGNKKSLKLAQSKPPRPGRNGTIKYYFELEHLKVGTLTEEGTIDFKDRGEIPLVKKGELLAERLPMVPGEPGIDVYGEPITVPDTRESILRCGPGAELSEDGMKAFAKIEGQPMASMGGRVSVSPELVVSEDVGFKTGHINFDGRVVVKGAVQNGFKVKSSHLVASEALGAEIDVAGDVNITGPVIGAKIKAQGRVVAHYFQNSEVSAYGDVIAIKEIMDSKIETSGICHVKSGKIVSSTVTAKKGIESLEIGTEISGPCTLKAGLDDHIRRQIEEIEVRVNALKAEQEKYKAEERALEQQKVETHKAIADLAQAQDRAAIAKRTVAEKKAEFSQKNDKDQLQRSLDILDELEKKIKSVDELINKKFELQDQQEQQADELRRRYDALDAKIQELEDEKHGIVEWSRSEKPIAIIKVRNKIHAGTKLVTPHATRILETSFKNVMLNEVRTPLEDGTVQWNIRVHAKK